MFTVLCVTSRKVDWLQCTRVSLLGQKKGYSDTSNSMEMDWITRVKAEEYPKGKKEKKEDLNSLKSMTLAIISRVGYCPPNWTSRTSMPFGQMTLSGTQPYNWSSQLWGISLHSTVTFFSSFFSLFLFFTHTMTTRTFSRNHIKSLIIPVALALSLSLLLLLLLLLPQKAASTMYTFWQITCDLKKETNTATVINSQCALFLFRWYIYTYTHKERET